MNLTGDPGSALAIELSTIKSMQDAREVHRSPYPREIIAYFEMP